jgi:hypothetical protein
MLNTKVFEVRDKATFVPVLAVSIDIMDHEPEDYLLARAGYSVATPYVLMTNLNNNTTRYDAFEWNDRTFYTAHRYIEENFNELKSGDVIDVEFILGESKTKKVSEYYHNEGIVE